MQSQWRAGEKKDNHGRAWDCRAELALQRGEKTLILTFNGVSNNSKMKVEEKKKSHFEIFFHFSESCLADLATFELHFRIIMS